MSTENPHAVSITVSGRVQRVGYRRYILDLAQELGVSGYIRNMDDGTVRIFCQAPQTILQQFIEEAKNPPPPAQIKQFEIKETKLRPKLKTFKIRYGPLQEELQEGFGAMQSIFMDYWKEFRDYRSEFRDYREEFRDYRNEFRSFVNEFRDYREEFREFVKRTDENFKTIMEKYGEISEKLITILETLTKESRETREMLNETMKLLKEAIERLSK